MNNPNCDNDKCTASNGPVKLYPIGGGGNAILCRQCWLHENHYRHERGLETGQPNNWPQENWNEASEYSAS